MHRVGRGQFPNNSNGPPHLRCDCYESRRRDCSPRGKSFDGRGNYAMGVKEHIVFPEINYDEVDQMWGMDVIVCTTAETDDEARALLKAFNFPFRQ